MNMLEESREVHADVRMLSVAEAAQRLGLSATSTRKIIKGRAGCHRYLLPGSKKAIIKIESRLVEELLTQSGVFSRTR